MFQKLLVGRFKLAVHRETKERPVLSLIVGKNGPKLKELRAHEKASLPPEFLKGRTLSEGKLIF
jgi:uncharacterized protein (TIGR03435 family)